MPVLFALLFFTCNMEMRSPTMSMASFMLIEGWGGGCGFVYAVWFV